MRKTISLLAVLALVAIGTVGVTTEAEAQNSECEYCDTFTGTCEISGPADPTYDECVPDSYGCFHYGVTCEIEPTLRTTADGAVKFASRNEAGTGTRAPSSRLDAVGQMRDCSGVILARAYSERALEQIRESTARISL